MKKYILIMFYCTLVSCVTASEVIKTSDNGIEITYDPADQKISIGYPYNAMYTFKLCAPDYITKISYMLININYFPFRYSDVSELPNELKNEFQRFKMLYLDEKEEDNAQER